MSVRSEPLVSIFTPVYNGEQYLCECIEAVLAQTYRNWEYTIINNCSVDGTLKIAEAYARKDPRIRVRTNQQFVTAIENHNIAFSMISTESDYCKVVSADDWLYPECVERLVEVAEQNPSVGIVGSYAISAEGVRWVGLPFCTSVFKGREVCRIHLLGTDVLGGPTSVLYRSVLVRDEKPFYRGTEPGADVAASFRLLQTCDFGFVHQVLCFDRVHEKAISTRFKRLNSFLVDRLDFLLQYGPTCMSQAEYDRRLQVLLKMYYEFLAAALIHGWDSEFWEYHKRRGRKIGLELKYGKLFAATLCKVLDLVLNPKLTAEKLMRRFEASGGKQQQDNSTGDFAVLLLNVPRAFNRVIPKDSNHVTRKGFDG